MDREIERLRTLGERELKAELRELKAQLFLLRFQNSTGQLDLNHKLRQTRVTIARILTLLRGFELGIEFKRTKTKEEKKGPEKQKKETK